MYLYSTSTSDMGHLAKVTYKVGVILTSWARVELNLTG